MRYTEMLEQYKGYGEMVKGLRDALEPMAGYQSTLASDMSAWTAASSVSKLFDNQLQSVIQSYSGGKITHHWILMTKKKMWESRL